MVRFKWYDVMIDKKKTIKDLKGGKRWANHIININY